ncbi:MAG: hypothetical protein QXQ50_04440 [Candidatus Bathyarchaeia archaeon]
MISLGRALLFLICLNIACWIVCNTVPIIGVPAPVGININEEYNKLQEMASSVVATNPAGLIAIAFGYIWFGLTLLWQLFSWSLAGFPMLLAALGVPTVISIPLTLVWGLITVLGIIEYVGGRELT